MIRLTRIAAAALASATALGSAGVAAAHPGDGDRYGGYERERHDWSRDGGWGSDGRRETAYRAGEIRNQLDRLARIVERDDQRDRISWREAEGLRREVREARRQFQWMNRDGLDHRELRILQARVDRIRFQLRGERGDWNDRRG